MTEEKTEKQEQVHAILRGTLQRLEEEQVLGPDETIVEQELSALDGSPGALFVTNERVLFFRASAVSDKTSLVALPLAEVTSAEASERRSPIKKRGVLRLGATGDAETVLEHIPGGQARAEELAGTILGRRDGLSSA